MAVEHNTIRADRDCVRGTSAEASSPQKCDRYFGLWSKIGGGNMMFWQPFRRHQIDILLDLRRNWFPILYKRRELPLTHLALQFWPVLHDFGLAAGLGIHNIACRRYREREVKLIKA